ncbi:hypothetical protein [Microbacterium lacus]|uniref:Uncharacterized protein n=1 Tax=Microbacterium lacus TaxID=415217 RepID=A0ABP4SC99_9MICO
MASIKKVNSHLDAARHQIESLQRQQLNPEIVAALANLHAALDELASIVRSDRV